MSLAAINAVLALGDEVTGAARMILVVLANHANDDMEAWPKQSRIADQAGVDPQTVKRTLRGLIADGYLDREVNGARSEQCMALPLRRRPNLYRLTAKVVATDVEGYQTDPPRGVPDVSPVRGTRPTPRTVSGTSSWNPLSPRGESRPDGPGPVESESGAPPENYGRGQAAVEVALFEACYPDPWAKGIRLRDALTGTELGRLQVAARSMIRAGATPDEVAHRARLARVHWSDVAKVTPAALDRNWAGLGELTLDDAPSTPDPDRIRLGPLREGHCTRHRGFELNPDGSCDACRIIGDDTTPIDDVPDPWEHIA